MPDNDTETACEQDGALHPGAQDKLLQVFALACQHIEGLLAWSRDLPDWARHDSQGFIDRWYPTAYRYVSDEALLKLAVDQRNEYLTAELERRRLAS